MNYKYIISAIFALILFAGCSDYLDKPEEGKLPTGGIDYSDPTEMFQPVSGIYGAARTENGFSRWALYALISVRGDDVLAGGDQPPLTEAKNFNYGPLSSFWALNESWKGLYDLITRCNEAVVILEKYHDAALSEEVRELSLQYQSEVRFVRAYAYFWITRLWGDIPVYTDNMALTEDIPKTKRADVYQFLNDELDICIANLPLKRPNQMPSKGQVTRLSAWGLKAKVNADINNWEAVFSATQPLIDSDLITDLYPVYYDYFKTPGKLADETLFELQYLVTGSVTILSDEWFAFQGPRSIISGTPSIPTMEGGWNFLPASDRIVKTFEDRNETVRTDATFLFDNSVTLSGDTLRGNVYDTYNGKAYFPSSQLVNPKVIKYGAGNNIRMLRYADILLLNAEARVNLSKGGADAPFNMVRRRADMPELTGVTLQQIWDERDAEFALEWGERYFDLLRTDRAQGTLPRFVKGQSEFYPIPVAQIDLNPLLK